MTNTRMFRGRIRMSTCRIILITSLAWLLIDVIIIMKYTDTLGSGLFKRSNEYNVEVSASYHVSSYSLLSYLAI